MAVGFVPAVGPYLKAKTTVRGEGGMGAWRSPLPAWL